MQKAVIVCAGLEEVAVDAWSCEVDSSQSGSAAPLRSLLADGWRVVHSCAMASELDACCLLVLEAPGAGERADRDDAPLADMNRPSDWLRLQAPAPPRRAVAWDGETISLKALGL